MCRLRNTAMGVSQTDRQTDGRTDRQTDDGQSDPYVSLCFAGDTKMMYHMQSLRRKKDFETFLQRSVIMTEVLENIREKATST